MNGRRDRRLAKLEQDRRPAVRILYVWRDGLMKSAKKTIARRFPKGLPAGARLVICSWQFDEERILSTRG